MKNKKYILRIRSADKDIFDAIRNGKKKIETRAATIKYQKIKKGDDVILICGKSKLQKKIAHAHIYKTITDLLKKYTPQDIHQNLKSQEELEKLYYSFPGYQEKIKQHGLIALELI